MWSVNELVLHCTIEVVLQHWTVIRVCNRNDALNALTWSQATQVSYTVLGDDDHGVVLSVVNVGSERNNRRNSAVLSNRWGHEGGDVAVTGEVTRTTGTVHDAGAAHVGGVDVAVDVSLNHAVGRNQTDTTDNLWVVRDLLRTQDDAFLVAVSVLVHLVCVLRGQSERGSGSNGHLARVDQVQHAVLDNLGVGLNVFELGVQKTSHHSVRNVAHAGLHDEAVVL